FWMAGDYFTAMITTRPTSVNSSQSPTTPTRFTYLNNPDLKPIRSHGVWISKYSYARDWKYRLFLGGDYQNDNIINTSRVDASGVTYSSPINFEGTAYNIRGGTGINRTFELENQK